MPDSIPDAQVAIKYIDKGSISDVSEVERVSREFFILTSLEHRNVIRLYEVLQDDTHLYLVMEFASEGTLDSMLTKLPDGKLDEAAARRTFSQIAAGVRFCHRKRVAHRDLKPENILVCSAGNHVHQFKIADFGLSNTVAYGGSRPRSPVGTPLYAAPEVLFPDRYPHLVPGATQPATSSTAAGAGGGAESDGSALQATGTLESSGGSGAAAREQREYTGCEADVWSMGVILYRLVFGKLPFPAENMRQLRSMVFEHKLQLPPDANAALVSLLRGMLELEPLKRLTAEEVAAHPWCATGMRASLPSLLLEPLVAAAATDRTSAEAAATDLDETADAELPAAADVPAATGRLGAGVTPSAAGDSGDGNTARSTRGGRSNSVASTGAPLDSGAAVLPALVSPKQPRVSSALPHASGLHRRSSTTGSGSAYATKELGDAIDLNHAAPTVFGPGAPSPAAAAAMARRNSTAARADGRHSVATLPDVRSGDTAGSVAVGAAPHTAAALEGAGRRYSSAGGGGGGGSHLRSYRDVGQVPQAQDVDGAALAGQAHASGAVEEAATPHVPMHRASSTGLPQLPNAHAAAIASPGAGGITFGVSAASHHRGHRHSISHSLTMPLSITSPAPGPPGSGLPPAVAAALGGGTVPGSGADSPHAFGAGVPTGPHVAAAHGRASVAGIASVTRMSSIGVGAHDVGFAPSASPVGMNTVVSGGMALPPIAGVAGTLTQTRLGSAGPAFRDSRGTGMPPAGARPTRERSLGPGDDAESPSQQHPHGFASGAGAGAALGAAPIQRALSTDSGGSPGCNAVDLRPPLAHIHLAPIQAAGGSLSAGSQPLGVPPSFSPISPAVQPVSSDALSGTTLAGAGVATLLDPAGTAGLAGLGGAVLVSVQPVGGGGGGGIVSLGSSTATISPFASGTVGGAISGAATTAGLESGPSSRRGSAGSAAGGSGLFPHRQFSNTTGVPVIDILSSPTLLSPNYAAGPPAEIASGVIVAASSSAGAGTMLVSTAASTSGVVTGAMGESASATQSAVVATLATLATLDVTTAAPAWIAGPGHNWGGGSASSSGAAAAAATTTATVNRNATTNTPASAFSVNSGFVTADAAPVADASTSVAAQAVAGGSDTVSSPSPPDTAFVAAAAAAAAPDALATAGISASPPTAATATDGKAPASSTPATLVVSGLFAHAGGTGALGGLGGRRASVGKAPPLQATQLSPGAALSPNVGNPIATSGASESASPPASAVAATHITAVVGLSASGSVGAARPPSGGGAGASSGAGAGIASRPASGGARATVDLVVQGTQHYPQYQQQGTPPLQQQSLARPPSGGPRSAVDAALLAPGQPSPDGNGVVGFAPTKPSKPMPSYAKPTAAFRRRSAASGGGSASMESLVAEASSAPATVVTLGAVPSVDNATSSVSRGVETAAEAASTIGISTAADITSRATAVSTVTVSSLVPGGAAAMPRDPRDEGNAAPAAAPSAAVPAPVSVAIVTATGETSVGPASPGLGARSAPPAEQSAATSSSGAAGTAERAVFAVAAGESVAVVASSGAFAGMATSIAVAAVVAAHADSAVTIAPSWRDAAGVTGAAGQPVPPGTTTGPGSSAAVASEAAGVVRLEANSGLERASASNCPAPAPVASVGEAPVATPLGSLPAAASCVQVAASPTASAPLAQ